MEGKETPPPKKVMLSIPGKSAIVEVSYEKPKIPWIDTGPAAGEKDTIAKKTWRRITHK